MSDKSFSIGALIALFLAVLTMRGPVTGVGPIAGGIVESLSISWQQYGFLSALPVLCFGAFCASAPGLCRRFGMNGAIAFALASLALGCSLRLVTNYYVLLVGTVFVGGSIAILNTVLVVVLRAKARNKVAAVMGIFTGLIGLSGAAGAYLSVPLFTQFNAYQAPFAFWAALTTLAFLAWAVARPAGDERPSQPPAGTFLLLKRPVMWCVMLVMGLQSLTVYTVGAWLPTMLANNGMSTSQAGISLSLFLLIGLPASMLTGPMIKLCKGTRSCAMMLTAFFLIGIALWPQGGWIAHAASLLAGIAQAVMFSIAFVIMSEKSSNNLQMLQVSSLAQGLGYLTASLGPYIFGLIYESSPNSNAALVFLASIVLIWGFSAWFATGQALLFDEEQSPASTHRL